MFIQKENTLTESRSRAETECRSALARAGFAFGGVPASFHWSQLVNPMGDKNQALEAYETLLQQEPENKSALEGIAYLYQIMGYADDAAHHRKRLREVEARQLGIGEDDLQQVVSYLQAKTGEAEQPESAPASYIARHFDRYASVFDTHLVNDLEYQGPKIIASQLVNLSRDFPMESLLDLGCGTGLLARELPSLFGAIDGVDVSPNMLARAESTALYRSLYEQDISGFLQNNQTNYSAVVAADVFIYLGELETVFPQIHNALEQKGLLLFTTENSDSGDVVLRNTGRFQHAPDYIDRIAQKNGFQEISKEAISLRKEDGEFIDSYLYIYIKESD